MDTGTRHLVAGLLAGVAIAALADFIWMTVAQKKGQDTKARVLFWVYIIGFAISSAGSFFLEYH